MGSTSGQINAGCMDKWLKAMQEMQARQSYEMAWQDHMNAFLAACKSWVAAMSELIDGVAVVHHDQATYLFAVVKSGVEITLELRRCVASFGITIGAAFNMRTEAALTSSYPSNCIAVIKNAYEPAAR
jgi:fatty-acid desaturase